MGFPQALIERFYKLLPSRPTDGSCWLWEGAAGGFGYGRLNNIVGAKPKRLLAHRLSYEMHVGPVPKGLFVLHSCDVAACVEPTHLRVGTQKDNISDCIERKRFRPISGCKLTPEQAQEIKNAYTNRRGYFWGRTELAEKFGVTKRTIVLVAQGKTWNR